MPKTGKVRSPQEGEGVTEEERLRELIRSLETHRNPEIAQAVDAERHANSSFSIRQAAMASNVGESTVYDWLKGESSPTFEMVRKFLRALHPSGPQSDLRVWLMAGLDHFNHLRERLAAVERARRQDEVKRATREQLERAARAEAILAYVDELPAADRDEILHALVGRLGELVARREVDPGR